MHDLVVRGGTVVDGTGSAAFAGDVAIDQGVITAVGRVDSRGRREIDADGAVVAPGWVDPHTHYDGQVTWDDQMEGSSANGVTTVVMGNCGVGFAPVHSGGAPDLIDLMEGVENIPGSALFEGIPWGEWETFPEYLAFLRRRQYAVDVGALLPHGALRFYVMGSRALERDPATAPDVENMARLAEEAVRAGATGFSTSRVMGHRAMSGYNVPGTFAHEDELLAIAKATKAGGPSVLQAIPASAPGENPGVEPEHSSLVDEVRLLARISRASGLRTTFSMFQANSDPQLWRDVLMVVAGENARHAQLTPMVAPRAANALSTLAGYHLFMRRPTFLRLAHLSLPALVGEMRKSEIKAAILSEADIPEEHPGSMDNALPKLFEHALPLTFEMRHPIDYEPTADKSFAALAATAGKDPFEYLYDFLLEDEGTSVAVYLGMNYIEGNLDACRAMVADPRTVTGLSDAGAHVGYLCDMTNPTFILTHWVRDRTRGERLPIELVVNKNTRRPSEVFGFLDRGSIEVGMKADVNVIDLESLDIALPELRHDLPMGGSRFLQSATGYLATIISGVVTREGDEDTGARPGRLIRPVG